ncbi:hypothetical protein PENSPDRAFT_190631 [Peniophora sp. CONT]|nr:hypothetical protein PENSPDRAFT_190631 [Peniophora sp. CONT]
MSRHRFVRNLDLDAERDDGALSDGADEEMTPEQTAQMEDGLERVRTVLGSEAESGLSDGIVRDMLWEAFFDVDQTIDWLVLEQEKQKQARERKGERP